MSNIIKDPISATLTEEHAKLMSELKKAARAQYGENKRISDGNYDESLAVKCVNGTFVGKKVEDIIVYRGIPFVGRQPIGELRWKAPEEVVPDDSVYEAYYNGKCCPQREVEYSAAYIQGEDCLYLNIWKTVDMSAKKKPVMIWVHGGGYEIGGTVISTISSRRILTLSSSPSLTDLAYLVSSTCPTCRTAGITLTRKISDSWIRLRL